MSLRLPPPARTAGTILMILATTVSVASARPTAAGGQTAAQAPAPRSATADPLAPFKPFLGRWQGKGEGAGGPFTGRMEFQAVLGGRFLQVKGDVRAEPQAKAPQGQGGEDLALIGYDPVHALYELRQFRSDGSTGYLICRRILDEGRTFIFASRPEDAPADGPRWKVTYRLTGPQEFGLTVERAEPDKDYEKAAAAVFRRAR